MFSRRRISRSEPTGVISYDNLIGAKVKVRRLSMQNNLSWSHSTDDLFVIDDIQFRVSVDGKCFSIVSLDGVEDRSFTLKDLQIIELSNNSNDGESNKGK